MKNPRLPAFTIMELLMAMTLTSFLVLAAWYAFELIQKQYFLQKQMNEQLSIAIQLETRLKQDIAQAIYLDKNQQVLTCHLPKTVIAYEFLEDIVLRKRATEPPIIDTFLIKTLWEHSYLKGEVKNFGLIGQIHLSFFPFEEAIPVKINKPYSPTTFMNHEY